MNFYYHYFVFNQAIRTMHFMPGYADYLPIPSDYEKFQDSLVEKCDLMISLTKQLSESKNSFLDKMRANFGVKKVSVKLDNFIILSFDDLLNEIKRLTKKKLSIREQDEWEGYFKKSKTELLHLKRQIDNTELDLNQLVYELYRLNQNEILLVQSA
ncbi:MAG: hypothetical protein AB7V56_09060 [Candidatus Nitrosocosmicus sp.]